MENTNKDLYTVKIDQLTIRGGRTSEGVPSIIIGMPSAQKENRYIVLKIDGTKKLRGILNCISNIV